MKESSIAAFAGCFFKIYDGNGNILETISLLDLSVNCKQLM